MAKTDPQVELVIDARAVIGESLLWVPEHKALYWVDIKAPALYRTDPDSLDTKSWELPAHVGAFALADAGRALVALRTGLFWLDLATGTLELAAAAPFDSGIIRFNEGACDSTGRFWVGIMVDPLHGEPGAEIGFLYSFRSDEGLVKHPDTSALMNGMAWNADETRFFLSHSYEKRIFSFPFANGKLGEREDFAVLKDPKGIPDGAAMDAQGGYWCAVYGAGCLHRYTKAGTLDKVVPLPVSLPTMCCFAGPALDVLYISSAREKLSPEQEEAEPHAGGVFRMRPGIAGQPKPWRVR